MKTSMSRSTFKILFYVKKGSERANGYLPLMCRLTVDGEIKQFSCKLDVLEKPLNFDPFGHAELSLFAKI